jgi:hypothetical protein
MEEDLMRDQPLGTTQRWNAEPMFPDLMPEPLVVTVTKPMPQVKLPPRQASGDELRQAGMAQAWDNTPANWRTAALTLLYQLARTQPEVTTDDLQAVLPPLPQGAHPNVMGGLWTEAVRQHIIRRTDRTIISTRPNAHARRVPVYASLLYRPVSGL